MPRTTTKYVTPNKEAIAELVASAPRFQTGRPTTNATKLARTLANYFTIGWNEYNSPEPQLNGEWVDVDALCLELSRQLDYSIDARTFHNLLVQLSPTDY